MYPFAKSFRSHHFFEHNNIYREMQKIGIKYDSNLNLFFQPNIEPLRHATGIMKLPIFWEDDIHYKEYKGSWNFFEYLDAIITTTNASPMSPASL